MTIVPKLLLLALSGSLALAGPATAQTAKKKVDPRELACGEKMRVEDGTCPAGQILEISGSCFDAPPVEGQRPRGIQYNCVARNSTPRR